MCGCVHPVCYVLGGYRRAQSNTCIMQPGSPLTSILCFDNKLSHLSSTERSKAFMHNTSKETEMEMPNSTNRNANGSFQTTYDVPTGLICLLAFLYGIVSLLAVLGNGLVIVIIVRNQRMHTVTNIFIANLAVADVIIGMFSIPFQFQAALLQRWVLANFMCSLAPMVQVISVNVSIFTLTIIAVDRYIAVIHPFRAGCSQRWAAVIITATWILAVGLALPYALFFWVDYLDEVDGEVKPWCSLHDPPALFMFFVYYSCVQVAVQYLFPLVVISFCYSRIAWHIWGSHRPGTNLNTKDARGRNRRKAKFQREFRSLFGVFPCKCLSKTSKDLTSDFMSNDTQQHQLMRRASHYRQGALRHNFNKKERDIIFGTLHVTETLEV
ncbi:hypothetical protein C0Q70_18226 [Pomacea canaliculata]|uniref:G-protein coupled receptors family 1 profile domain-containing protein n=1 Tax=Pomacea canaliculata TaxID=400727 RepID=A0A2T7NMM5_POMCA|nr:hypothetical protein C0Q70_18226 [Pomacea canaliculata]